MGVRNSRINYHAAFYAITASYMCAATKFLAQEGEPVSFGLVTKIT